MLPEISNTLIARAVQTARMVGSGEEYWLRGRVRELTVNAGRDQARALVKGSEQLPYEVALQFGQGAAPRLVTSCTCPVGSGCKHVAAALFALQAKCGPAAGQTDLGNSPPSSQAPELLPPALSQWLTAMRPLMREAQAVTAPASSQVILYVVRAQALTTNARMSAKRSASSLAPAGRPVRLFVEALEVTLDATGRPVGSGDRFQSSLLYHSSIARPAHFTLEDQHLVRRLTTRIGETDSDGCLASMGGFDLLEKVIATGRARWGGVRGPTLQSIERVELSFSWVHDPLGQASLALAPVSEAAVVALIVPPVVIDTASGGVSVIRAGVTPAIAEQLLRLPAVGPDAIDALAARWSDAAPERVPAPARPDIQDLGIIAPVPVLSLLVDRLQIDEPSASPWRYGRKVKVDCAVARLGFDYGVAVINAGAEERPQVVRSGEGLVRFARDMPAEGDANLRLIDTELMPLEEFEGVYPTPAQEWDHAPCAPAAAQDFTGFLLRDADVLRQEGWRIEQSATFPLKLIRADAESLQVVIAPSGIDWFDLELGAMVEGQRVDLVPALYRLLSSLGRGEVDELMARTPQLGDRLPVALGDGRVVTLEAQRVLPMLRALLLLATQESDAAPGARPRLARRDLGLLAELETTSGLPWTGEEPLRRLARSLCELSFTPTPLPNGFKATLRPYQQTGLDWLEALGRSGLGGLLADDMGLGKTVQTLAHIAVLKAGEDACTPVLIVAPTSVLPNWQAEAARFAPDLSVLVLHGPDRHRRHGDIAAHDVVLTSYPLLVRDLTLLTSETFKLVVFDEAHNLKNPRTASHAAAQALVADRKIALTGTPVENRLLDAWALFQIVTPGLLGSQRAFTRAHRALTEPGIDPARQTRLARKLKPFLLRRTKEAVATELPAKSIVPLYITLDPAQMALHESQRLLMHKRVRDEISRVGLMRAQIIVLTALTRLRQICCDPRLIGDENANAAPSAKLQRLLELLEEMIPQGRRIILFSQFTTMLDLIKPELDRRGVAWVELTGRTKDRKTPISRFQSGNASLILVSLKAGGTGLNLTAADTVVLYDPWWNPAIEAQAIDRAHRIGQTKPVFVYRMVAAGTIEEKILALQQRKATLADALWSEDAATPTQLTEDDIAFLLG
jgi:superfamily II DNA or RNA helicase